MLTDSRIGCHQHTILTTDFLYQFLLQDKIIDPLNGKPGTKTNHCSNRMKTCIVKCGWLTTENISSWLQSSTKLEMSLVLFFNVPPISKHVSVRLNINC